jgi:hypothetical protein
MRNEQWRKRLHAEARNGAAKRRSIQRAPRL